MLRSRPLLSCIPGILDFQLRPPRYQANLYRLKILLFISSWENVLDILKFQHSHLPCSSMRFRAKISCMSRARKSFMPGGKCMRITSLFYVQLLTTIALLWFDDRNWFSQIRFYVSCVLSVFFFLPQIRQRSTWEKWKRFLNKNCNGTVKGIIWNSGGN